MFIAQNKSTTKQQMLRDKRCVGRHGGSIGSETNDIVKTSGRHVRAHTPCTMRCVHGKIRRIVTNAGRENDNGGTVWCLHSARGGARRTRSEQRIVKEHKTLDHLSTVPGLPPVASGNARYASVILYGVL